MNVLVIYDVTETLHDKFKEIMFAKAYHAVWVANGLAYKLPKTCLWKQDTSIEQAYNDCMTSIHELGTTFDRLLVVPATPWKGIQGR